MSRSRRRGRRGGAKAGQVAMIAVLSVALVGLVGGIAWLVLKAKAEYVPRDQASLCPLSGYTSQTLVLVDTTDPLAAVTKTQVLAKLRDLVGAVPKDGLLEIRQLSADPEQSPLALEALCNPGDGSDIDPVTGNPDLAKKRWETAFAAKVETALESSVSGAEQDFSPIMEAIQRIAAEHLTSAHDRSIPTRLVIVSDMIQHTPTYSHYSDGLSLQTYKSKAGRRLATDLAGAEVDLWMVARATQKVDPKELGSFWAEWTELDNGKAPAKITPLMGM